MIGTYRYGKSTIRMPKAGHGASTVPQTAQSAVPDAHVRMLCGFPVQLDETPLDQIPTDQRTCPTCHARPALTVEWARECNLSDDFTGECAHCFLDSCDRLRAADLLIAFDPSI